MQCRSWEVCLRHIHFIFLVLKCFRVVLFQVNSGVWWIFFLTDIFFIQKKSNLSITLLALGVTAAAGSCSDISTDACRLLVAASPNFCTTPSAQTECPAFCGLCSECIVFPLSWFLRNPSGATVFSIFAIALLLNWHF